MSILENESFRKSENGKMLQALLDQKEDELTITTRRGIALTEDVVILREISNYDSSYYDEAYRKIGRMLKLDPNRVKRRHEYLQKHNAKIEKNPDGTVKRVSLSGLKHKKIKREVDSKLIDAIEVRCDVLESLAERNLPATVLAIVKVTKALDPDDLNMFLWELIKAHKEQSAKLITEFLELELVEQLISGRKLD